MSVKVMVGGAPPFSLNLNDYITGTYYTINGVSYHITKRHTRTTNGRVEQSDNGSDWTPCDTVVSIPGYEL